MLTQSGKFLEVNIKSPIFTYYLNMATNAHAPKPFQLECSTDRDNLHRWWSILTNYGRRDDTMQFYPGGAFENWKPECRDLTRGIPAILPKVEAGAQPDRVAELAQEAVKATDKRRNVLANLLTIFASYTPPGTFQKQAPCLGSLRGLQNFATYR